MAPQRCSFLAFFAAILVATTPAAAQQVKWAVRHDTSSTAVRNVDPGDVPAGTKDLEASEEEGTALTEGTASSSVLQSSDGSVSDDGPGANFDGLGVQENLNLNDLPAGPAPPDPNAAVGGSYVVQMMNTIFAVYDKNGSRVMDPKPNNALWNGFGGLCETTNEGDPIVLYDEKAQRWVLSQFARNGNETKFIECVAVSETSDPTGNYYRYAFEMSDFNDFPKLGVGLDSYTYTHKQIDSGRLEGPVVGAFERDAMLNGQNARQVLFGPKESYSEIIFLPADIDGNRPPNGTPNFYVGLDVAGERLRIWKTEIDWSSPNNATFEEVAILDVQSFDADFCDRKLREDCISQPNDAFRRFE